MYMRAAFRELYCRATNPARALMLWDADVRAAGSNFADFRARMMALLKEVTIRPTSAFAVNFSMPPYSVHASNTLAHHTRILIRGCNACRQ